MSNRQTIPFPLPEYLATYFGNKLNTDPDLMTDGSFAKPFYVSRTSDFGKYVLSLLKKATSKNKREDYILFYISISNYAGDHDKDIAVGKYSFLQLDEKAIKKIVNRFKSVFEMQLMAYISGAESQYQSEAENKRVRTRAIREFCKENNVLYSPQNLEAWKKQHQRLKKSRKELIYNCL